MPLSAELISKLKQNDTEIEFKEENPRRPGSKPHERYDTYKVANTIGEATQHGAKWADLTSDFQK
eukprot:8366777-Pyramimonas_sp.AAC.1